MGQITISSATFTKGVIQEIPALVDQTASGYIVKVSCANFPSKADISTCFIRVIVDFGNGLMELSSCVGLSGQIDKYTGKPVDYCTYERNWPDIGGVQIKPISFKVSIEPIVDFGATDIIVDAGVKEAIVDINPIDPLPVDLG
jgi:hypothetical protein